MKNRTYVHFALLIWLTSSSGAFAYYLQEDPITDDRTCQWSLVYESRDQYGNVLDDSQRLIVEYKASGDSKSRNREGLIVTYTEAVAKYHGYEVALVYRFDSDVPESTSWYADNWTLKIVGDEAWKFLDRLTAAKKKLALRTSHATTVFEFNIEKIRDLQDMKKNCMDRK